MKICVLGAGSWGIALSLHLQRAGHSVALWGHHPERMDQLNQTRENKLVLPGIFLPPDVLVTSNLAQALEKGEGVVFAVPSQAVRTTAQKASAYWAGAWTACAAKGLEEKTHLRMTQVLAESLPTGALLCALSGPSHAEEVSRKMPTTVVAASDNSDLAALVQKVFHTDYFRVYTSKDLPGVELGGALKNVIAIAAGILDGLGLGDNTKAALVTRGLHEMTRLGLALGASRPTFAGLAGMGDLMVTCTSRFSRNRLLGEKIGKGAALEQALKEMVMVAEGIKTCREALALAEQASIDVPIMREVFNVLFNGKKAKEAMASLLSRSAKPEQDFEN